MQIMQKWFFSQPPDIVWNYLTLPDLIEKWLGRTDFEPVVGHKFRFISPYGNDSICEVLEVQPFVKLSYSWQKNSAVDNKPFASRVEWTLVPVDGGTELRLQHSGFAASEDVTNHSSGWNTCGELLEQLLKVGR